MLHLVIEPTGTSPFPDDLSKADICANRLLIIDDCLLLRNPDYLLKSLNAPSEAVLCAAWN